MSDENQEVEQITMPTANTSAKSSKEARPAKPKDPKKVAAGKRLAEYNRKAKEALKKEVKREEEQSTEEGTSNAWIPEISFTTALSIVGVGLTVFGLLMRYRANAATGGYHVNAATEGFRNFTPTTTRDEAHTTHPSHEVLNDRKESKTCEGRSVKEGLAYPKTRQPTKFGMD